MEGIRREKESLAAQSHKFRKLMTPTKCRECESYVFVGGFECRDCGLSAHPKCLEVSGTNLTFDLIRFSSGSNLSPWKI